METVLNTFISQAMLPTTISEAMFDQDYSLLAMRKYSEGAKDYWMSIMGVSKRLNTLVADPIRVFLHNEVRVFKDMRRNLEQCQKSFDSLQAKYAGQGKSKEPSSLREDAFQLHEARRAYLKASMDFFHMAPQLKFSFDKLLVRIFFDQWREMRVSRDHASASFSKNAKEMERVQGWSREMENGEIAFRRELLAVKKELEDAAELEKRPSRELEDYSMSTAPFRHSHTPSGATLTSAVTKTSTPRAEKQGWLYLRTYGGKPTRTLWVRRWAFVRQGIFGWLVQGARPGGVEESEHIGVLLCNVRSAGSEDRRFCFEVKTKKHAIMLQAETQADMTDWLGIFESAKSKALEDPQTSQSLSFSKQEATDSAFSISAPPIPEFGMNMLTSLEPGAGDDGSSVERSNTLPIPGQDAVKDSTDNFRRSTTLEREDQPRETSRIRSKLDLHRRSAVPPSPGTPTAGGGIASLIAASHGSMPISPGIPITPVSGDTTPIKPKVTFSLATRDMPPSSLAPSTLANPPAPTSLSKTAVIVTGERGLGAMPDRRSDMTNGLMANMWGTSNWAQVNRLDHGQISRPEKRSREGSPLKPLPTALGPDSSGKSSLSTTDLLAGTEPSRSRTPSPGLQHRNTISVDGEFSREPAAALEVLDFPNYYPLQLKTQDAQFRLLFPSVPKEERLVMVFRATWNPNDQRDFPGRAYVTSHEIYFYSHHLGLVLATGVAFDTIDEVTAAPGKDCDFLFLHLKEPRQDGGSMRITIKTFLEPLRLLQKRLNFLVRNSVADESHNLESIIKLLIKMEQEAPDRSPSMDSIEEVSPGTPLWEKAAHGRGRSMTTTSDYKAPIHIDRTLGNNSGVGAKEAAKFKLPAVPVNYTPAGNVHLAAEKQFDISPKALFHVLFGDKSAVWQLLQHERRAEHLKQGPWINLREGRLRRDFDFIVPTSDVLGRSHRAEVRDYQVVDVNNDHLCYVVTDKRTAWHLPFRRNYRLVSKVVITHVAKGKCKLAIFTKVEWLRKPWIAMGIIERSALEDLNLDALDLADVVTDQVRRLGPYSRTKRAVQIFGQLGQSTEVTQIQVDSSALNIELRRVPAPRTLLDLLKQDARTWLVSGFTMLLEAMGGLVRLIFKTFSAHTFILALLGASVLFNTYHSYLDTTSWYQERSAGKFMARLGITPNLVMSKAVHVNDLDDLLSQDGNLPFPESSTCYAVFHDEHRLDDIDAPLLTTTSKQEMATQSSAQHLQRTRQRLGTYRHDLLVAMRVVNSIEKEVLQTEWEEWVAIENRRCRKVQALLQSNQSDTRAIMPDSLASRGSDVQRWYDDYCVSCRDEHERLTTS